MKAKLIINDKELEVEISEEELKKLEKKPVKKTGYERVDDNQVFGTTQAVKLVLIMICTEMAK